jgi:hypothetical protein
VLANQTYASFIPTEVLANQTYASFIPTEVLANQTYASFIPTEVPQGKLLWYAGNIQLGQQAGSIGVPQVNIAALTSVICAASQTEASHTHKHWCLR